MVWQACRDAQASIGKDWDDLQQIHGIACRCEDCLALDTFLDLPWWKQSLAIFLWGEP